MSIKKGETTFTPPQPAEKSRRKKKQAVRATDHLTNQNLEGSTEKGSALENSSDQLDEIAEQIDEVCARIDIHQAVTRQLAADTQRGLADLAKVVANL